MIFNTKTGSTYQYNKEAKTLQRVIVGEDSRTIDTDGEVMGVYSVGVYPEVGNRPVFWLDETLPNGDRMFIQTSRVREVILDEVSA